MATFRFHLVGVYQPLDLEVAADAISDVSHLLTHHRFLHGWLTQADGDGVLLEMLIATSRVQSVCELS